MTTPGGTATHNSYDFVAPAPTVSSFAPTGGPISGGTTVTITGTGLFGATSVLFGTVAAPSFTVVSPTAIVAKAPAHAVGTVAVKVVTHGGSASASGLFGYLAWTKETVPLPSNATLTGPTSGGGVQETSCPRAGWCLVAGSYRVGSTRELLFALQTGTQISSVEGVLPSNAATHPNPIVTKVSCAAVGTCVVVGSYISATGADQAFIDTLKQGSWTSIAAPAPANSSTVSGTVFLDLRGLHCWAQGSCIAVGAYTDTTERVQGLIETETGGTWTPLEAPVPANGYAGYVANNPNGALGSLSCPSTTSCVAAGDYVLNGTTSQGPENGVFVDTLSGGSWSATQVPLPSNATTTNGLEITFGEYVSCASVGQCAVTANYFSTKGSTSMLATLASGTWQSIPAPRLSNGTSLQTLSRLWSTSCAATGSCAAVGIYRTNLSGHPDESVIETRTGGTWSAHAPTIPSGAGATGVVLRTVTCPSSGACVAVGTATDVTTSPTAPATTEPVTIFENQIGTTWLPKLVSGDVYTGTGLACPSAGSCEVAMALQGKTGKTIWRKPIIEVNS